MFSAYGFGVAWKSRGNPRIGNRQPEPSLCHLAVLEPWESHHNTLNLLSWLWNVDNDTYTASLIELRSGSKKIICMQQFSNKHISDERNHASTFINTTRLPTFPLLLELMELLELHNKSRFQLALTLGVKFSRNRRLKLKGLLDKTAMARRKRNGIPFFNTKAIFLVTSAIYRKGWRGSVSFGHTKWQ